MKKCQYCKESIQSDALKCKHCGEWLEKPKRSFFQKAKASVSDKIQNIKENKVKHLYIPTGEKPMIFDSISFYTDYFKIYNKIVRYDQISHIEFKSDTHSLNFVESTTMTFALHYRLDNNKNESLRYLIIGDGIWEKGLLKDNCSKKIKQQLHFLKSHLEKITLEVRKIGYLNQLQKDNFFNYKKRYIFYPNGDLEVDGEIKANVFDAQRQGEVNWTFDGSKFSINPDELLIGNKTKKSFSLSGNKTSIEPTYDFDIFFPIFMFYLKKKQFISTF